MSTSELLLPYGGMTLTSVYSTIFFLILCKIGGLGDESRLTSITGKNVGRGMENKMQQKQRKFTTPMKFHQHYL